MASYKCLSCIYYQEEYAPYIHAKVPVCSCTVDEDEERCNYIRKEEKTDEVPVQD